MRSRPNAVQKSAEQVFKVAEREGLHFTEGTAISSPDSNGDIAVDLEGAQIILPVLGYTRVDSPVWIAVLSPLHSVVLGSPQVWVESEAVASMGTNWTLVSLTAQTDGNWLQFALVAERINSALTVAGTGDVTNETIAVLEETFRGDYNVAFPLSTGSVGRMVASFYNPSTGGVRLSAVGGTGNIAIGDQISCGGVVRINP